MIYYSYLKFKKKEFGNFEFSFWFISWTILILLVLFPYSLDFIIKDVLQMSRTLDFFIIIGFMFLIGLTFYTYNVVNRLQKRMEKLIREIAIKRSK